MRIILGVVIQGPHPPHEQRFRADHIPRARFAFDIAGIPNQLVIIRFLADGQHALPRFVKADFGVAGIALDEAAKLCFVGCEAFDGAGDPVVINGGGAIKDDFSHPLGEKADVATSNSRPIGSTNKVQCFTGSNNLAKKVEVPGDIVGRKRPPIGVGVNTILVISVTAFNQDIKFCLTCRGSFLEIADVVQFIRAFDFGAIRKVREPHPSGVKANKGEFIVKLPREVRGLHLFQARTTRATGIDENPGGGV